MTRTPFLPGEGWLTGEDGVPFRRAARVLLLDADDRVLLVRAHDAHRPSRTWWFTVGGGIDDGESAADAALREVREETGLAIEAAGLVGPVATRSAVFDFHARHVRQHEVFYAYRLASRAAGAPDLSTAGWTEVERSFVDELAWWSLEDLRRAEVEVFPAELADLVRDVLDHLPRPGEIGTGTRTGTSTGTRTGSWTGTVRDLSAGVDAATRAREASPPTGGGPVPA